jgi:hypothetical protein
MEPLVEFIEQHQSQDRSFVPVFLTDSTAAHVFRSRGFIFEYLPPLHRVRLRGSKPWADYAAERRRLLARKWGMADIITFGDVTFGRPKDSIAVETTSVPDAKAAGNQRAKPLTRRRASQPTVAARPKRRSISNAKQASSLT